MKILSVEFGNVNSKNELEKQVKKRLFLIFEKEVKEKEEQENSTVLLSQI